MFSNNDGKKRGRVLPVVDSSSPPPEIIVGKIYADWCEHCKVFIPEWNKLLNEFKKEKRVEMVKIGDTEKNRNLAITVNGQIADFNKKYKTTLASSGFPTIFIFYRGKIEYYNGERSQFELSKWIHSYLANLPKQMGGRVVAHKPKRTRKTWFDRIFATRRKTARKMA